MAAMDLALAPCAGCVVAGVGLVDGVVAFAPGGSPAWPFGVLSPLDLFEPVLVVESLVLDCLLVESFAVESFAVESLAVESLAVESLAVESLPVESLAVEALLVCPSA